MSPPLLFNTMTTDIISMRGDVHQQTKRDMVVCQKQLLWMKHALPEEIERFQS